MKTAIPFPRGVDFNFKSVGIRRHIRRDGEQTKTITGLPVVSRIISAKFSATDRRSCPPPAGPRRPGTAAVRCGGSWERKWDHISTVSSLDCVLSCWTFPSCFCRRISIVNEVGVLSPNPPLHTHTHAHTYPRTHAHTHTLYCSYVLPLMRGFDAPGYGSSLWQH